MKKKIFCKLFTLDNNCYSKQKTQLPLKKIEIYFISPLTFCSPISSCSSFQTAIISSFAVVTTEATGKTILMSNEKKNSSTPSTLFLYIILRITDIMCTKHILHLGVTYLFLKT